MEDFYYNFILFLKKIFLKYLFLFLLGLSKLTVTSSSDEDAERFQKYLNNNRLY